MQKFSISRLIVMRWFDFAQGLSFLPGNGHGKSQCGEDIATYLLKENAYTIGR